MRRCENCGASLDGRRRQARYCGGRCRAEASRLRSAERAAAAHRQAHARDLEETAQKAHGTAQDRWCGLPLATADEESYLTAVQSKYPELMADPI